MITFHASYVLMTARSAMGAQFISKLNCWSHVTRILFFCENDHDVHFTHHTHRYIYIYFTFHILWRTQLDALVERSVHCPVWIGPMITSYCTTTAARTCWCRLKKNGIRFAHFLFKILSVIHRVRQLYLHCKKYRPITSAVSTKNRCSVYGHLINKTA